MKIDDIKKAFDSVSANGELKEKVFSRLDAETEDFSRTETSHIELKKGGGTRFTAAAFIAAAAMIAMVLVVNKTVFDADIAKPPEDVTETASGVVEIPEDTALESSETVTNVSEEATKTDVIDVHKKENESEITSDDPIQSFNVTTENSSTEVTNIDIEMPDPFPEKDGDSNMLFYASVTTKLDYLDMSFIRLVGYDEAMDWLYNHSSSQSEFTDVGEAANLYSFIRYFNIPDETVRELLISMRMDREDDFSDEEIDIILSGDNEAVAEHFASEMAIRKGSNLYSLHWIYNHSIEDYAANGITAEEIKEKLPLFEQFPLTVEAKQAIELKIKSYVDFGA